MSIWEAFGMGRHKGFSREAGLLLDEAVELIKNLQADGLPYVSFKPGTVDQIRQVVRIAKAVAPHHHGSG